MKTAGATLIAAALLFASGCVTRPDWIEATLVTVDVNGVWQGAISGAALPYLGTRGSSPLTSSRMEQRSREGCSVGPVTSTSGISRRYSGPLAGRVGGDVLNFTVTSEMGEGLAGELTVRHDEMEGMVRGAEIQGARVLLRRIDSPSRLQRDNP